jgi:hypothetical protein
VVLQPGKEGWIGNGGRRVGCGGRIRNSLWAWVDSAFNKTIGILAFKVGNHLPLPSEVIVSSKLGCYSMREVIEEGGWRNQEVWGWVYSCSRRGFGGNSG